MGYGRCRSSRVLKADDRRCPGMQRWREVTFLQDDSSIQVLGDATGSTVIVAAGTKEVGLTCRTTWYCLKLPNRMS